MKPISCLFRCLVPVIPALILSGCNPAPHGFPQVVPCTIIVTKDNVPLPQVMIKLVSEGGKEWLTAATSDPSGVTELRTMLGDYVQKGAPPGQYKVVLSQIPQVKSRYTQQQLFDMSQAEKDAENLRRQKEIAESRSFPVEFENAETTPISIDVTQPQTEIPLDVAEWIGKK